MSRCEGTAPAPRRSRSEAPLRRCTWRSMSPGRTVAPASRWIAAPSGTGTCSAGPAASIVSPLTMTAARSTGEAPVPVDQAHISQCETGSGRSGSCRVVLRSFAEYPPGPVSGANGLSGVAARHLSGSGESMEPSPSGVRSDIRRR